MKRHILQAHRILARIFDEGTYSNIAFYDQNASDMATLLVYGVLENNLRTDYIINTLVDKKPQRAVSVLLKIGIYALENLSDVPKFAIVSECVESAKAMGKGGAGGFVNAVLKKVASGNYCLPKEGDKNYLSVTYSKPQWFIDKLEAQYGHEVTLKIISAKSQHLEHVRVNGRLANVKDVIKTLEEAGDSCAISEVGGITVRGTKNVKRLFGEGILTYQSPSSMLAVKALAPQENQKVLDICSAPGGKAIYASETCINGEVIACELHEHRIKLIEKYKKRMRAKNVKAVQADATKLNEEWTEKFDCVLADVPCSCFGTFLKHPDVFMSRGEAEIASLALTQSAILKNAAQYVKKGGTLVYSTCTLFEEENNAIVNELLEGGNFECCDLPKIRALTCDKIVFENNALQILPNGIYDGFFIAKLKRIK